MLRLSCVSSSKDLSIPFLNVEVIGTGKCHSYSLLVQLVGHVTEHWLSAGNASLEDLDPGEDYQARALKRPRLVWTAQLHQRFVDAVKQLGLKNAVPKTIMQVPGPPPIDQKLGVHSPCHHDYDASPPVPSVSPVHRQIHHRRNGRTHEEIFRHG